MSGSVSEMLKIILLIFIGNNHSFKSCTTNCALFSSFIGAGINCMVLFQASMEENMGFVSAHNVSGFRPPCCNTHVWPKPMQYRFSYFAFLLCDYYLCSAIVLRKKQNVSNHFNRFVVSHVYWFSGLFVDEVYSFNTIKYTVCF